MMQWIVIGIAMAIVGAMIVFEIADEISSMGRGISLQLPAAIVAAFAHGMWITMDRKRLGLEVGWWRFAALLFGPVAIWVHLIVNYRRRALWLLPVSLLPYIGIIGFELAAWAIAAGLPM